MISSAAEKQLIIIDTDAGVDDAIALMMILAEPSANVIGITTVSGNVDVEQVTANVGVILDQMDTSALISQLLGGGGDNSDLMKMLQAAGSQQK